MDRCLKSLGLLWANLASINRYAPFVKPGDIETFWIRLENEGLPYLTRALPTLGKALDEFHATRVWNCPVGFGTDKPVTPDSKVITVPEFLGTAVIEALKGDSLAVDCVRQLTLIFYKLEVPYEEDIEQESIQRFRAVDGALADVVWPQHLVERARKLIGRVLCNRDPLDIRPRHGAGATACRTPNHEKHHKLRFYPKLAATFDYSSYFFFSATHLADELEKLESSEIRDPWARLVFVPKDSRGPRMISCEPAEHMYIQQGLMTKLYEAIESHPLTSGYINFNDQRVNQDLARWGSLKGDLATLDLVDASDRVSLELVRLLFPADWFEALNACRSEETVLPDGSRVKLNKFAPMGSACCFPVEALVFWACAMANTKREEIYVYGDDIICSVDAADKVMDALEQVGLLVNRSKSYVSGPFRESCGGDYHFGVDVTPVRVRQFFAESHEYRTTAIDLANNFIAKFGSDATNVIDVIVGEYGPIPCSMLPIPGTLRLQSRAVNDTFFRRKWNSSFQRFEHRIPVTSCTVINRCEPAWSELLRKELSRDSESRSVTGDDFDRYRKTEPVKQLLPGQYVDLHSTRNKWTWVWLGESESVVA